MASRPRPLAPDTPVQYLKGVGPVRAQQMRRLGLETAEDLLHHYPVDYVHRGTFLPLGEIRVGMKVVTEGRILDVQSRRTRHRRSMVVAVLGDGPARLQLTWFNAPYMTDRLCVGRELVVAGEVSQFGRRPQIVNPQIEDSSDSVELTDDRPQPRYPLTAGLKQGALRKAVHAAVDALTPGLVEPLPESSFRELGMSTRAEALARLHRPDSMEQAQEARRRLAFDEALALQLAVGIRRDRLLRRPAAVRVQEHGDLSTRYVHALGFPLTGAQRRVLSAISRDLKGENAMHRLVQGDVGSGKTLVALVAMIWMVEAGAQAAFMAPTEVLARQHGQRQHDPLAAVGLRSAVLTGSTPAAQRREILSGLRDGSVHCVFGTHALIQDDVVFQRLGLAVVDEQHRFGVLQRAALSQEGAHVLVMSATPIPRSLALTVYGDLDLSVVDELPPGRTPIQTEVVRESHLDEIYADAHRRAGAGERTYLVFPLVAESEASDLASAETAHAELSAGALQGLRVGLLHGRMKPREKDAVSQAFAAGELDVLVATTVIEVGIDVPEASLMVIHQAERFGLAQLHQLRGRVGRGSAGSRCVLVEGEGIGPSGRTRLRQVAATTDGFRLAELDLRERGMGDLHGLRQHGDLPFRLLHPLEDEALITRARETAREVLARDPQLTAPGHRNLREWLEQMGRRNPLWSAAG